MVLLIIRENSKNVGEIFEKYSLKNGEIDIYQDAIYFDLEHYIYKKPICIGVFGCAFYDKQHKELKINQYMIENKKDAKDILNYAKVYFENMKNLGKKYIVTFSGNNDFTVINYLFEKYNIDFKIKEFFKHVDLQREYEKVKGNSIGLKDLEKEFNIERQSEVISGQNLAKTFGKVIKDREYIERMPEDKKNRILLYNEQDVVSLFYIITSWFKVIKEK
ncbi:ribonuclease H-like domain-containing protein [Clostridium cochlearium]|uniref:Ribonuclease H-like domain-containing protein n=1 Tax=Clostridium cochlearium TaxID=1494 RepID=A0A7Y3V6J9_CLOCO|nr:ribonuclease H-like domain-containing protein [Clostridium cochlearium]